MAEKTLLEVAEMMIKTESKLRTIKNAIYQTFGDTRNPFNRFDWAAIREIARIGYDCRHKDIEQVKVKLPDSFNE